MPNARKEEFGVRAGVRRGFWEAHAECPCSLDDHGSSVKSDDRSEHGHSSLRRGSRGFRQSRIHPRMVDAFRLDAVSGGG